MAVSSCTYNNCCENNGSFQGPNEKVEEGGNYLWTGPVPNPPPVHKTTNKNLRLLYVG